MNTYTYNIYDETDRIVDTVIVVAKNWLPDADAAIDAWLDEHPGMCVNPNGPEHVEPVSQP